VEISTRDKGLKAALESERTCRKHYGADMCKKIQLRLAALKAAISLVDFWPPKSGPERCHELKGERAGVFSVDVKQPYRLLFAPSNPTAIEGESDERARWAAIKEIELITIEDTHG
jgi:plasmid maintenance system killer protein